MATYQVAFMVLHDDLVSMITSSMHSTILLEVLPRTAALILNCSELCSGMILACCAG